METLIISCLAIYGISMIGAGWIAFFIDTKSEEEYDYFTIFLTNMLITWIPFVNTCYLLSNIWYYVFRKKN
jgi:hypothetical protein